MGVDGERGALVREYWEAVWNRGDLSAARRFFASEITNHGRREPGGADAMAAIAEAWRTAFPDLRMSVEQEVVQGEDVVHRMSVTGTHRGGFRQPMLGGVLPATGRTVHVEQIHIHRVRDGRIVGHRAVRDDLTLFQQLGVLPAPAG